MKKAIETREIGKHVSKSKTNKNRKNLTVQNNNKNND